MSKGKRPILIVVFALYCAALAYLTLLKGIGATFDMTYAEYVAAHSSEWTNIMTNLGFYWADASAAVAEPNWDSLDWATLTQAAK